MSHIKLQELLKRLGAYLKIEDFKDYGPNGLQVEGDKDLETIAFSTTASLEIIEQAIAAKASCLIVHHGLFWDKEPKVLEGIFLRKIKMLIEAKMSLIAYHLPLDAHPEVGNNAVILNNLGVEQIAPFETIGMHGFLHIAKDELIAQLEQMFGTKIISPPCSLKQIKTIACVSGAGHSYLKLAHKMGIEAFISGTADEWVWDFASEHNCLFLPLGHYRSETVGIKALGNYVAKTFGLKTVYLESQNSY